jgi:hypothetical protein
MVLSRLLGFRSSSPSGTGRIFGIGLSRTGTTSLASALTALGYPSVHFPADDTTRGELQSFLSADDAPALRLSVLDRVQSVTDTPACVAFEALDVAYPSSKFILTVRDKASWLDSCEYFWSAWVAPFLGNPENDAFGGDYIRAICESLYGGPEFDRARFSLAYDAYQERVDSYFQGRAANLLRMDMSRGDGWQSLCEFLACPMPAAPFPWANARSA